MVRMPIFEDLDDDDEIVVPKGWTPEPDDLPAPKVEPRLRQVDEQLDKLCPDTTDEAEDELVAPAPRRRSAWAVDGDEDEPVVPFRAQPSDKRRAWAVDEDTDEDDTPVARLRHHVSGAIDRGEAEPVVEVPLHPFAPDDAPILEPPAETPEPANDAARQDAELAKPVPPPLPVTRLSERAMLVSLNISQWSGRRYDRSVSEEVNIAKNASANAGRYNKVLFPDCEELAEIHRQTSSLRNWFVEQTLPWMNDGARIMPSQRYLPFNAEFRARQVKWVAAVDALLAAYPLLVADASRKLKSMYNPDDYPPAYELRNKFAMAVRVMPLPDREDFRIELDDGTMDALKAAVAEQEADVGRGVALDCAIRLHKVAAAMAERLSDPDAGFRVSLVDNLVETVEALKELNITGDAEIERLRAEAEKHLTGYSADELRIDMAKRKKAALASKAVAEGIAARMEALMG